VVHDVKLRAEGKEALHQIDVLIDGPSGQRRVLVECKDYGGESVGIDVIRDFNGALVQLQPVHSMVVTSTRLTAGACADARDEGITLVQLRPFTDADWTGRVRHVAVTATVHIPGEPTTTWTPTGRVRPAPTAAADAAGRVSVHEIYYHDASGRQLGTLHELLAPWRGEFPAPSHRAAAQTTSAELTSSRAPFGW
jgi:hypothetical protein